jgi:hypothetical protein
MNIDTEESANINPGPNKETFLHYYKELWINKLSSRQLLEYSKIYNEIEVMEELKETLKKKEKSPSEDNLNSELHKYARDSFHERLLGF